MKNIITEESYLSYYNLGKSDRAIALELGVHHDTVSRTRKRLGLKPIGRLAINKISETKAVCSRCFQTKNLDQFQWGRRGHADEYQFSYCNSCRKEAYRKRKMGTIEAYFSVRVVSIRRRAKLAEIDCSIEINDLLQLWEKQNGLCFYTDIPLEWQVYNGLTPASLSVDRVEPIKGYTKDNVVLCSRRANMIKSDMSLAEMEEWMPKWYERITTRGY